MKQQINTAHGINFTQAAWQDNIVILPCIMYFLFFSLTIVTIESQAATLWITNYFFIKKSLITCQFLFCVTRLWCSISDKFFITMCNSLSSYACSLQVPSALIFVDYILWKKTTTTLMWKTETHTFKCWTE